MLFPSPIRPSTAHITKVHANAVPQHVGLRGSHPATDAFAPATLEKVRAARPYLAAGAPPDGVFAGRIRRRFFRAPIHEVQAHAGFATLRTPNTTVHLGPVMEVGRFTKYHLGLDEHGALVGVKEGRIADKPAHKRPRVSTRARTPLWMLTDELATLTKLGSALTPHGVYVVDDKVYQIVKPMAGDMFNFHALLEHVPQHRWAATTRAGVRSMLAQIAHEMQRLHALGIMHRDIKPENILWDAQGRVMLGDFGFVYQGLTCPFGEMWGTPRYRAPEMYMRMGVEDNFTNKAEVFSLGMTVAAMFANMDLLPITHAHTEAQEVQAAHTFVQWRTARSRDHSSNGPLNWRIIDVGARLSGLADPFYDLDLFAQQFRDGDPQLCAFVYRTMLVANPTKRHDINAVAQALHGVTYTHHHTARRAFAAAASHDMRGRAIEQALRVYANRV